jgi:hypothetical protein
MIRLLIASLTQISQADIHFSGMPILFAATLTFLSAVCGTLGWAHIIRALHPNIAYAEAIRTHLLSVTTKYFPGFGWQQVSKVVQLTRNGVSLKSAALPVTLELSLVVISGAMIGSLCFVTMPVQRVFFSTQAITALGILSLIIFFLTPFLIAKWAVRRQANGVPSENYVRISIHLLIAQILLAVSWIFLGIGLWFTSRIFYETSSSDITYFIFSTVLDF